MNPEFLAWEKNSPPFYGKAVLCFRVSSIYGQAPQSPSRQKEIVPESYTGSGVAGLAAVGAIVSTGLTTTVVSTTCVGTIGCTDTHLGGHVALPVGSTAGAVCITRAFGIYC